MPAKCSFCIFPSICFPRKSYILRRFLKTPQLPFVTQMTQKIKTFIQNYKAGLQDHDETAFPKPTRSVFHWFLLFLAPVVLFLIAFLLLCAYLWHSPSALPSLSELERIDPKLATEVYDKDSLPAHEFFVERRIWVPFDSIPELAKHAVMATEDRDFYKHWGMNIWAIPGAIVESAFTGRQLRGASTLTQQLSKILFLSPERTLLRKVKEMLTAIRIERTYTKDEILEFYMNEVYLAAGNYGFEAAGQYFFGHPLDSLSVPETATLAGMLQSPGAYRPDRHPEVSLKRRNTVLYAMYDAGYITKDEYHKYINEPLIVVPRAEKEQSGLYFYEEVRKYMEKKYGEGALYSDGLSIYSTIDPDMQAYAEKAAMKQVDFTRKRIKQATIARLALGLRYHMRNDSALAYFDSVYTLFKKDYLAKDTAADPKKRKFPDEKLYHEAQIAIIIIDNETGAVRAMVGGDNFHKSKWNRATQSLRQPGSAFKPFVYATAMDNGAGTCDTVDDAPVTIPDPDDPGKTWRPENYDRDFEGKMTIRRALYKSKNLPAIQTALKYGVSNVVAYARRFGIQKAPLKAVPSLALGSVGATLMEMTAAYTVFPNGGIRREPYLIERVEDRKGDVIEEHKQETRPVIRPASAYMMVDMLKDVNIHGTAAKVGASGFSYPNGGKTGTTNDFTDSWYIGFTKQYTMGVWVGFDEAVSMGAGHAGSDDALPVWIDVMKEIHKGLPRKQFPVPSGLMTRSICNFTGKVAGEFCTNTTLCMYSSGNAPTEICDGNHFNANAVSAEDASLFSSKETSEHSTMPVAQPGKKKKDGEKAAEEPEKKREKAPRKMF